MSVGHGDSNSRNVPTLVKDISNVGKVVCGSSHTIAVSQDSRTVWSFGGGDNGKFSSLALETKSLFSYTKSNKYSINRLKNNSVYTSNIRIYCIRHNILQYWTRWGNSRVLNFVIALMFSVL